MNEQQRIEVLIQKAGSARKLAALISTSPSSVTKLRTGVFHLDTFASRIAVAFPDLNCRWLLTGEGEPWVSEHERGEINQKLDSILSAIKKK